MNRRQVLSFLILFWTLAPMASSHAQALKTQDCKIWNVTSQTVFPQQNWLRYETPEEAGWSANKLSAVQKLSDRAGSAAVTVIYNGAILTSLIRGIELAIMTSRNKDAQNNPPDLRAVPF
jgi:hypothetical protein